MSTGMRTSRADLPARDAQFIGANQKLRFFPLSVVAASGSEVTDHTGRKFLDLSAAWGANGVGHAHPRVVAAVQEAAVTGGSASVLSAMSPAATALAEKLLSIVPAVQPSEQRVILGHSGTDANSAALAAARAATGRPGIVAFAGGYHGGFGAAQQVSGVFIADGLPAAEGTHLLEYPVATGDADRDTHTRDRVLAELDRALAAGTIAAVIIEPMQSDGGVLVPPTGFLAGVAERAAAAGALLICDEVKIGLGRTGKWHGFSHEGVTPDLVTFGKSLGGGLPLSAVTGPAWVLDAAPASTLLTTAGNSISAAAGLAVLEVIEAEGLAAHAHERGDQLRALVREAQVQRPEILEIRGLGLSLGIELTDPRDPEDLAAAAELTRRVIFRMWQLGVVCYLVRGNVIELTPPLNLSARDAERAVESLTQAIADVRAGLVTDADIAPFLGW